MLIVYRLVRKECIFNPSIRLTCEGNGRGNLSKGSVEYAKLVLSAVISKTTWDKNEKIPNTVEEKVVESQILLDDYIIVK